MLSLLQLPLVVFVLQVEQHVHYAEAVSHALVALEYEDRLTCVVVWNQYELVLNLVIWGPYALLLGHEISELLLRVNPVIDDLAQLRELVLELHLVHLLVVVLAHNLDQFGSGPEQLFCLGAKLLLQLLSVEFLNDHGA